LENKVCVKKVFLFFIEQIVIEYINQWRTATGNATTVATATFDVVKDNKA
jgi:hypothetical protein